MPRGEQVIETSTVWDLVRGEAPLPPGVPVTPSPEAVVVTDEGGTPLAPA